MIARIEKRRQAMYSDVDAIVQRKKGKRKKEIKGLRVEFKEVNIVVYLSKYSRSNINDGWHQNTSIFVIRKKYFDVGKI